MNADTHSDRILRVTVVGAQNSGHWTPERVLQPARDGVSEKSFYTQWRAS
jgi:hypothetical protein